MSPAKENFIKKLSGNFRTLSKSPGDFTDKALCQWPSFLPNKDIMNVLLNASMKAETVSVYWFHVCTEAALLLPLLVDGGA